MNVQPPSFRLGLRLALAQWRLVIAVWVAPMVLGAPLMGVAAGALRPVLAARTSADERWLLAAEALRPMWPVLILLAGLTTVALWAWTVLWHAGAARWQVWNGEDRPGLARVLGLGLMGWWRFARLSLVAGTALLLPTALVWLVIRGRCVGPIGETAVRAWALTGTAVTAAIVLLVWLGTLHGAWRLALPTSRSAAAAWLAGVRQAARSPFRSMATLVLWLALALAATAVSAVAVTILGPSPLLASIAEAAASAARAFCWVGLFAGFAPTAGIGSGDESEEGPRTP